MAGGALLGALALLATGGCATHSAARRGQTDLQQLQKDLPGTYTDRAAGEQWSIQPVEALAVGDPVYFVRKTAADNPRLVLAQAIWTLGADKNGRIVQHLWLFQDTRRWDQAVDNPDMLLSLLPQDLRALSGCDLTWTRMGTDFATSSPAGDENSACRPGVPAQGLWIERSARLSHHQLSVTERHVGNDGTFEGGSQSLTLVGAGGSATHAATRRNK